MPKLTIVIPNYNGGENLKRAIESCGTIRIPENDYEILIVDNKSTDNSIKIANEMKIKFTNIRIVQNEKNLGRIQNWNISIEKAKGKYLIFLFANDLINEKNNIHESLQNLDSDQTISICMSALLKKEKSRQYIKKAYFDKIIKCSSKKFALNCLNRGLLPFGPIQSIIYRLDDIMDNKNKFLEEFPINADEIFSFEEACKRENIAFNPHPQITWDLTQSRFHGKVKIEEEFKEHSDTIEIIKNKTNLDVNYGLISTYRAINLIKFSAKNFQRKNGKKKAITHLLSKIKESGTFFNTDKILIKTLFDKLKNSDKDADDLLHKLIITRSIDESNN
jgi:glycosyltransferase involved in cell wall biosynthesis